MNVLGDLLRERRDVLRRRGLSVRQIAAAAGLAESVVYDHLAKYKPYRQTPTAHTLEGLAKGFQLDLDLVWKAAKEATGEAFEGNPLQVLLTTQRSKLRLSDAQISREARELGFTLSKATLSNLMTGKNVTPEPTTIKALSKVLKVPAKQIEDAAAQASRRVTYRLPRRLEEQLTPAKWDQIVQLVEGILILGDQP